MGVVATGFFALLASVLVACDDSVTLDCDPLPEEECVSDPESCAFGKGPDGVRCYSYCDPEAESACGASLECVEAFLYPADPTGTSEPATFALWYCLPPDA